MRGWEREVAAVAPRAGQLLQHQSSTVGGGGGGGGGWWLL